MPKSTKNTNEKSNNARNDQFIADIYWLQCSMKYLGLRGRTSNWISYLQSMANAFVSFGLIAGLIVHIRDADIVIDILSLLIPLCFFCLKWITFGTQRRTMEDLRYYMEKDWINLEKNTVICQSVPDSKLLMKRYCRFPKIFFFTATAVTAVGDAGYVWGSLASMNSFDNGTDSNKLLPLPHSWYPVNYDKGFNFEVLVVVQTVTTFTMSVAAISIDSFFAAATLHLCGQFRILRYFIEGIKYDSSRPEYCKAKVRLMAQRHQILLGLAERVQEAFTLIIFNQFAATALNVCFMGYVFITELEKDDASLTVLLRTGCSCGDMLLWIYSYCIAGGILTNESAAVAMAVYNTEWYHCTKSINLSFTLVMTRAGKPLEITGAKLFPMSLESFVVIIKMAVSYLSVLRAVSVSNN